MPGAQLTTRTAQQYDITTASIQKAENENRKSNGNALDSNSCCFHYVAPHGEMAFTRANFAQTHTMPIFNGLQTFPG